MSRLARAIGAETIERLTGRRVSVGNKYGARRTEYNGRVYDSATEAAYAAYLDRLCQAGAVRGVLPQVPFTLPGGTVYRADFLVHTPGGLLIAYDVKGHETQAWRIKWREVKAAFPWIVFRTVRHIDHEWIEGD